MKYYEANAEATLGSNVNRLLWKLLVKQHVILLQGQTWLSEESVSLTVSPSFLCLPPTLAIDPSPKSARTDHPRASHYNAFPEVK